MITSTRRPRIDARRYVLFEAKDAALAVIAETFGITPLEPYGKVRALQAAFDPGVLKFSGEYYDALGIERE